MSSSLVRFTRIALGGIAFGLFLSGSARAQFIMPGYDALRTLPGTFFDIGLGPIAMTGNGGSADTVVRRLAPIDLGLFPGPPQTIPIEIVALDLKSVAPVSIASSFFDVFVELQGPGPGTDTMEVSGNPTGGTFDSFFDIFVNIRLTEVGNPSNTFNHTGLFQMRAQGTWHVDSFFDIYYDPFVVRGTGTGTWGGGGIVEHHVTSVPEPFTMGLGVAGALAAIRRLRRQRCPT